MTLPRVAFPATLPQELKVSFYMDEDAKERVREATNIIDLIGRYIPLRREGSRYVGICPWHDDSRPSLQVSQQRQTWKCFVCNDGGDAFSFVQKFDGISFPEALQMLADDAGIQIRRQNIAKAGTAEDKPTLLKALQWADEQFCQCLASNDGTDARTYLEQRQLSDASLERFRVGYSPNSWQWLVDRSRTAGFSTDVLKAAGLIGISERTGRPYDLFRGRVIFPIRDSQGRTIAFGGRIMPELADDKTAKYYNSRETRLFSKSKQLYGFDLALPEVRKTNRILIMEGYTDVIMASQFGVTNAAAVLGTALTADHLKLLTRMDIPEVVLLLDGDAAGQRRANEVLELFVKAQFELRIATLPDNQDPCDFLLQHGAEAMGHTIDQATDALQHKLNVTTQGIDLVDQPQRANQALEEVLSTLSKAPRALHLHVATMENSGKPDSQVDCATFCHE